MHINISMKLDLHGLTVHTAWKKYRSATQDCYFNGVKKITVVTGHGIMSTEFNGWTNADPYAVSCERQDPNTGSWTVRIKKNLQKSQEPEPVDLTGLYKKFNKR